MDHGHRRAGALIDVIADAGVARVVERRSYLLGCGSSLVIRLGVVRAI